MNKYTLSATYTRTISANSLAEAKREFMKELAQHECNGPFLLNSTIEQRLPDVWKVGQIVEYVADQEYGPSKGSHAVIHKLSPEYKDAKADEYQVFWTHPLGADGTVNEGASFWTTPADVSLVRDLPD